MEVRRTSLVWFAAICGLAALLATATSALAISAPIHIAGTGGQGVNIRPTADTSQAAIGWIPEGASPDYNCYVWGQRVGTVPIWFNVNYGGVTGFYSSYYDDSSYHSDAELQQKYGVPLCGQTQAPTPTPAPAPTPVPTPAPTPSPAAVTVFSVVDADGGVYFRNSPSWNDVRQVPGAGVYTGDQVRVQCGSTGEPHGPNANTAWSYVANLSRPGAGSGWVSEHYINDGAPANGFPAGVGSCGPDVPGAPGSTAGTPSTATPSTSGPGSVFFSPIADVATGEPGITVADLNLKRDEWSSGDCSANKAYNAVPSSATILAGWSAGRLGPMYFLAGAMANAGSGEANRISTIILIDPGSKGNMEGGCDQSMVPTINNLLAEWLKTPSHRLLVLAGSDTEDHSWGGLGGATYSGLWTYYFKALWNTPEGERAQVCDYRRAEHHEIMRKLGGAVRFPPSGCPVAEGLPLPTSWHP